MDVKEGHCWRCEAPGTDVSCKKCNKAKYCGDKCRIEDNERHEPQCEIWKPAICSNPGCEVSEDLKECTGCFASPYCNVDCQRKHLRQHKQICRQRLTTIQENSKSLAGFFMACRHRKLEVRYYTGNVIAVDMLHLQTNELVDAGDAERVLRQDYSILSAGCGNLRNLIYTITSLPDEFQGKLMVTLNDIDPFIQARNVLFLFMMIHFSCDPDVTSKTTTIWYSLHLSKDVHEFLMKCLKMLCATNHNAARLKITTHGIVDVSQENYDTLRQVWQGWIKVDQQQASGQSQSIKEQRNEAYFGDRDDLYAALGYLASFTAQIPERHGKSIYSWMYNGDFLSSGKTAECGHLNPTLTGKCNRGFSMVTNRPTGVHETSSEIPQSPSEVQFVFCVPLYLMPFADWDYLQASKFSNEDSLLVMYHAYVTNQIKDAMTFATDGRLAIRVNLGNCMKITEGEMKDDRFDRIFTSNLVDYIGTKIILDAMKPLLNTDNKNAVIVTQYWTWQQYFPLSKVDNQIYHQNGNAERWIQSARKDTKLVLVHIPISQHAYQEYFNNTPYFIDYLRADLKACRYVKETDDVSCSKVPTFAQVKRCSDGLRMRDFRRDLNKVVPWRYRCNVRAVNMLPGYSRCLEWYLI